MVFTGNHGTARLTVVRLFAQIRKEKGWVSGNLVEVGRSGVVGRFVEGLALHVRNLFTKTQGGVLFIDEANALLDGSKGLYGDETINTIVEEMENYREDVIVIFAGYPESMEDFLAANPGLSSRIASSMPRFLIYPSMN